MNLRENFVVGLRGLRANALRSVLTMLGIFIGVLAVILGTAAGSAAQTVILRKVQTLGTNSIIVFSSQDTQGKTAGDTKRLRLRDAAIIRERSPLLTRVSASFSGNAKWKYLNRSGNSAISCATPDLMAIKDIRISTGRNLSTTDVRGRRKVVVLGGTRAKRIFTSNVDEAAMLGKTVRIQGVPFRVIGITQNKGASLFENLDESLFVPLTTGMKTIFGAEDPTEIMAQVPSSAVVDLAKVQITRAMRQAHRLKAGEKDDFQVFTQQQLVSIANFIGGALTALLSGIAAVALLVGGIGIMNIMLVSVTERTREIGIRKAVGARQRDIRLQFLFEATALSVCGGLAGILTGVLICTTLGYILKFPVTVSIFWAATAFVVSAAIGIFFGLYPASKAAKLDPIEALRYQ